MNHWEVLVAGIALLAGLWGQAKRVINWMSSLLVVTVLLEQSLAESLAWYLENTGSRRSRSRQRLIGKFRWWLKPLNRHEYMACEKLLGTSRTFWLGKWPIWYAHVEKPICEQYPCAFSFFRGTVDWEVLAAAAAVTPLPVTALSGYSVKYHAGTGLSVIQAAQKSNATAGHTWKNNQQPYWLSSFRPLRWKTNDLSKELLPRGLAGLSLTPELQDVASEMRRWLNLESWYSQRGIPWRAGYLFQGVPGSGKTALARAVAEELDLPVHVFDLASMSNNDLRESWAGMLFDTPCIVLLEDLDGVFHGRVNVSAQGGLNSGGLTFDVLLNCIDGIEQAHGVLLIVTTNHPELVDPALANREGRIDRIVKFDPLDLEGRLQLARRIIGDTAKTLQLAVDSGPVSAAKFVLMCQRVALEEVYNDPYRTGLPPE